MEYGVYYVGGTPEWEEIKNAMCLLAPSFFPEAEDPNAEAEAFCNAIDVAGSGQAVSLMMAAHYT